MNSSPNHAKHVFAQRGGHRQDRRPVTSSDGGILIGAFSWVKVVFGNQLGMRTSKR
jgi:hypothetical protein